MARKAVRPDTRLRPNRGLDGVIETRLYGVDEAGGVHVKRWSVPAVLVLFITFAGVVPARADDLTASCRADLPVPVGKQMTWRAQPSGGSGDFRYSWSGDVSGTTQIVKKAYGSIGYKVAHLTVIDNVTGQAANTECAMHVIPTSFAEPPSVTPVLWVPDGVDPAPMVPRLKRVWRSVRATFFHLYGKTFRMRALKAIASTSSEAEICGGDCTNLGKANQLMDVALREANDLVHAIPYTRAFLVTAWGAGGWAGAWGWDIAKGGVGDWALAPAVGRRTPSFEPDIPDWWFLNGAGQYINGVSTIAHELNHAIGWDDPHDFSILQMPNDYERAVSLAGPFLTQSLVDTQPPAASLIRPAVDSTVSGTTAVEVSVSDSGGRDGVQFLVDEQPWRFDAFWPYRMDLDTTLLGHGRHVLSAIAFDDTGNTTRTDRVFFVENVVPHSSCRNSYPLGTFHACFFDGLTTSSPYLGTVIDHPFPVPANNAGFGPWHGGDRPFGGPGTDEIAFGRSEHLTGVWRGTLDLRRGRYLFSFFTDDGLRVRVDGVKIIDSLVHPQVAAFDRVVQIDGPTQIFIRWYENEGGQALTFRWKPTAQ
jgi:hypothetical protein